MTPLKPILLVRAQFGAWRLVDHAGRDDLARRPQHPGAMVGIAPAAQREHGGEQDGGAELGEKGFHG